MWIKIVNRTYYAYSLTRSFSNLFSLFFIFVIFKFISVWQEKKAREDSNTKLEEYKDSVVDVKEM